MRLNWIGPPPSGPSPAGKRPESGMNARRRKTRYALSRRKKNAILIVFFFFVLPLLIWLDRQAGGPLRSVLQQTAFYTQDQQRYHGQAFTVVEVIDGDTIDLDCPDGPEPVTRVRLLGIDTPETKHPQIGVMYYGPEASRFVTKLAQGQTVTVLIDTIADQRDYYGRLLAYIRLPDGRILNEEIIRHGFGYADLRFDHTRAARYEMLMDQAIESGTGLWADVTREQFPNWLRQKRPTLRR